MHGPCRIIDLSVPLEHQAVREPMLAQIRYIRHDGEGLQQMQRYFGVKPEDLVYSQGLGWAIKEIQAITHAGTHVDAPYHFASCRTKADRASTLKSPSKVRHAIPSPT